MIYCFDVDDTLICGGPSGPVKLRALEELSNAGHMVGICGNFAAVTQLTEWSQAFLNFFGPMAMSKPAFLSQVKMFVQAEDYIFVGNILGVTGGSDDKGSAAQAGWRFIQEAAFAGGAR